MDQNASPEGPKPAQASATSPVAPTDCRPPVSIPDHQLLRCIGRGSFGEVWLARNIMGVHRAVKIVYRKSFDSNRPFDRELSGIRKFEPISRSHEGFMDILHVGMNEEQGYFYCVMELGDDQVSGQTIDPQTYSPKTLLKEISLHGKLSVRDSLKLGLDLSRALAELHKQGLVHRDIKPSNIIFVNGVPKLADIGLVTELKNAHTFVGTDGFIPKEGPGTAQADLYSLGKVLYEASTGMDRLDFPNLPAQFETFPDHDDFLELNEVVLQACSEAGRRYKSAWDMHAHLLVVANGGSVKRLKLLERRLANLKRAAGITLIILLGLAAVSYQVYREWQRINEARQQKVGFNVASGLHAMDSGDFSDALPYFAEALESDRAGKERQCFHLLRFNSTLSQCPKLCQMWFDQGEVGTAELSPDGQNVLVVERYSGKVEILDVASGQPACPKFGHDRAVWSASYSTDGVFVVTASEDFSACIWQASDGKLVQRLPHSDRVFGASFSPDGSMVVTACKDKRAWVWDWRQKRILFTLSHHTAPVLFAAYSPDGTRIVTTSKDETAQIWDATTHKPIGQRLSHSDWVYHAAFSPDGQTLLTACGDKKARAWELLPNNVRPIRPDLVHSDHVHSVQFSPDGRLILTAGFDNVARLWLADNHQPSTPVAILRHSGRVMHAAFSSDGRRIVTGCADGTVRVWDLAGPENLPPVLPRSYSPDGKRFLETTDNGVEVCDVLSGQALSPSIFSGASLDQVRMNRNGHFLLRTTLTESNATIISRSFQVWDVANGKLSGPGITVSNSAAISNAVTAPHLSDDGKYLVTYSNQFAEIWDVQTGTKHFPPLSHPDAVVSACFSRDGHQIAIWGLTSISVWNATTGRECFARLSHEGNAGRFIEHVEFSPDGANLVTCQAEDGVLKCQARVWNTSTGQLRLKLQHGDGVLFASFSADGKRIVTSGEDSVAIIWDAVTGRQLAPSLPHGARVQSASFSPDGKWVVTASTDQTARIWSAETGDPLTPPLRHPRALAGALFLADGRRIVTLGLDGANRVWELPVDARPAQDLRELAYLVSGGHVVSSIESTPNSSEALKSIWVRLRSQYPSEFSTSPWQIEVWHDLQARECERQRNWAGQAFHLQHLLAIHPGDPSLTDRLNLANQHLEEGE